MIKANKHLHPFQSKNYYKIGLTLLTVMIIIRLVGTSIFNGNKSWRKGTDDIIVVIIIIVVVVVFVTVVIITAVNYF